MVSTCLLCLAPALFLEPVLMVARLAPLLVQGSPPAILCVLPSLDIDRAHALGILFPLPEIVMGHETPSFTSFTSRLGIDRRNTFAQHAASYPNTFFHQGRRPRSWSASRCLRSCVGLIAV